MTATTQAYILLVITTLGWSANSVVGKFAVGHVGPMTLTLARWTIGLAIIVAISLPQPGRDLAGIPEALAAADRLWRVRFHRFQRAALHGAQPYLGAQRGDRAGGGAGHDLRRQLPALPHEGLGGADRRLCDHADRRRRRCLDGSLDTLLHMRFNAGDLLVLLACFCYAVYTVGLRYKPDIHWKSLMGGLDRRRGARLGAALPARNVPAWFRGAGCDRLDGGAVHRAGADADPRRFSSCAAWS